MASSATGSGSSLLRSELVLVTGINGQKVLYLHLIIFDILLIKVTLTPIDASGLSSEGSVSISATWFDSQRSIHTLFPSCQFSQLYFSLDVLSLVRLYGVSLLLDLSLLFPSPPLPNRPHSLPRFYFICKHLLFRYLYLVGNSSPSLNLEHNRCSGRERDDCLPIDGN